MGGGRGDLALLIPLEAVVKCLKGSNEGGVSLTHLKVKMAWELAALWP